MRSHKFLRGNKDHGWKQRQMQKNYNKYIHENIYGWICRSRQMSKTWALNGIRWGFFSDSVFLYFLVNNNETGPQPPQQGVVNSWRRWCWWFRWWRGLDLVPSLFLHLAHGSWLSCHLASGLWASFKVCEW